MPDKLTSIFREIGSKLPIDSPTRTTKQPTVCRFRMRIKPDDFFSKPEAIADEVFHVAHQDRSTWAFDLVIRPFAEKW